MNQSAQPVIRVYEAVPGPGSNVKFVDEIVRYAPTDISFYFHSWKTALFRRYDVVHVHWPEFYVRDARRLRRLAKRLIFRAFLVRIAVGRIPVVRTVHNVQPHHSGDAGEQRLLRALDRLVRRHVVMSVCTPVDSKTQPALIPHGDFVDVFSDVERKSRVRGRILLFGRIHPYKGALELIEAASEIKDPSVEVRIVGLPTEEMRSKIEKAVADYEGGATLTTDLRMISDEEMVAELTSADLIALPYQDAGNGNSGVAMVGLSLGRPVLVYRSCIMEDLASETGEEWIQMIDGQLSGVQLEKALQSIRGLDESDRPRLVGRDWTTVAQAYARVFRETARGR